MRTTFVVVACLFVLSWATLAAGQQSETSKAATGEPPILNLTVDEAVDEAIRNNLALLAERMSVPLAEAGVITAALRPNPVLTLTTERLDPEHKVFNNNAEGGPPEFSIRVDVPFETANKRQLRVETANYGREIAEARLLDAIRKLKLDVALGCIDVMEAKAKLALAGDNLRTFEEVVRINQTKVTSGFMARQELTRSQVAMLQFRGSVKRAELELVASKTRLQNLLGRLRLTDQFDILDDLKLPLYSGEFDPTALQEAALAARPDIQSQERTQARSRSELKLQLAQAIVDYTLGVEYRRAGTNNTGSNYAGLFFSMPIPLFNRNQGEIARVRAEQEQFSRQFLALKTQVFTEIKAAYQEFRSARDMVQSIETDLLQPAQRARDNSGYVYRAGASTLVEFLDAQRAFNETMQSYYEAQAAYRRAVWRLNNAVGKEVIP